MIIKCNSVSKILVVLKEQIANQPVLCLRSWARTICLEALMEGKDCLMPGDQGQPGLYGKT